MAEGGHVDENQNAEVSVFHRLAGFPLFQSAYQIASFAYQDVKSVHPVVGYFCEVSERGVKAATEVAALGVSPLRKVMTPQITALNNAALLLVDGLENKLPILDQPADEVVLEFGEKLASGVRAVRDQAVERGQNVLDRTREMASVSYEVISFLGSLEVRDVVKVAAYFVLSQAEELVERYLPEESDAGKPESSSSSEEIEEMDRARFSLVSRSQKLAGSVIRRIFRKLRPFLEQYWEFLQSVVTLLLAAPSQVRSCLQTVLCSVLPVSQEEVRVKKKKKAEATSRPGRSPGKTHPNLQQGFVLRASPGTRRLASNPDGGRVRARERRRQSFDSSFYPSRIQEDVPDAVFYPLK